MKRFIYFNHKGLSFKFIVLFFTIMIISFQSVSAQYDRKVVFEIFSEVWCGPCAALTPIHKTWLKNHPDYIAIYYYSYFMVNNNKIMNNPTDYNERKKFYSVPFYPYARINSELAPNVSYPGYPTDTIGINAIIDTMTKNTPVKIDIDFTNNGFDGNVKINLTSNIELNNKHLFVFLVEKEHLYEKQQNGLTDFHYIMRKTLPQSSGEMFSIKAGETKSFEYNYTLDQSLNTDLYATAIVQDEQTKYIYQSESVFKSFAVSVDDNREMSDNLNVFPLPFNDNLSIQLNSEDESIIQIQILDLIGNKISELNPRNDSNHLNNYNFNSLDLNLTQGVYILRVLSNKNVYYRKIIANP